MHNKLKEWMSSLLSHVGRVIMIKASVAMIPTFQMGIALLPNAISNDMEGIM